MKNDHRACLYPGRLRRFSIDFCLLRVRQMSSFRQVMKNAIDRANGSSVNSAPAWPVGAEVAALEPLGYRRSPGQPPPDDQRCPMLVKWFQRCTRLNNHEGKCRWDHIYGNLSKASHFIYWQCDKFERDEEMAEGRSDRFNQFIRENSGSIWTGKVHLHAFYFGRGHVRWCLASPSSVCGIPGRCQKVELRKTRSKSA